MNKQLQKLFGVLLVLAILVPSMSYGMLMYNFSKDITIEQGQIYELNFQGIDTYDVYIKYSSADYLDIGKWTNNTEGAVRILKYGCDKWYYDPSYGNSKTTTCTILGVTPCTKSVIEHQMKYTNPSGQEYLIFTKVYVTVLSTSKPKLTMTASPGPGDYNQSQNVKLSASESGATIFYTLNGTTPWGNQTYNSSERIYSNDINISETSTIKAFAVKKGYPISDVYTFQYNIGKSKLTLSASPEGGQIPRGSYVYLQCNIPDAEVYYTKDGSTPTKLSRYNGNKVWMYESCTLKAIAFKEGYIASDVLSIDYLVPYTFTANTTEGYEMEFDILDFEAKTCKVNKIISKDITGKVTIPAEVDGFKVTEIGDWAFSNSKMSSISIPDGVTTIGTAGFQQCENLTAINFPNSLKRLENQGLRDCKSLETITGINNLEYIGPWAFEHVPWLKKLPDGVIYLGKVLFAYKGDMPSDYVLNVKEGTKCIANSAVDWNPTSDTWGKGYRLVGVTIPSSVIYIVGNPFRVSNINSIIVDSNNSVFDSRNDCNAIIETKTNTLIVASNNTTIPSTVKAIGAGAFSGLNIKEIIIPDAVDSIGESAIYNCAQLESITIGKGVRAMASYDDSAIRLKTNEAIRYNPSLKSITVSSDNPYFDSRDNCNAIIEKSTQSLRVGCATTIIPPSVVDICGEAFYGNGSKEMISFSIPDNIKRIGKDAFYGQRNLEKVEIGEGVTQMGNQSFGVFTYNPKLRTIVSKQEFPSDINEKAFSTDIYENAVLYVPISSYINYLSAAGWSNFKNIKEGVPPTLVVEIKLSVSNLKLKVGDNEMLTATITPEDATNKNITWSSNDEAVATINTDGLVTAVGEGKTTITCTANDGSGVKATCTIMVERAITKGDVNGDEEVNGTDLVALSNIVLGRKEKTESADVNGDGSVNGTDIVALSNIILGRSSNAPRRAGEAGTGLSIEPFDIQAGEEKEMLIDLTNPNDEVTLVQFDMHLPEGLSIKKSGTDLDIDMGDRTTWRKHTLDANETDGSYRFLLYSGSNTVIDGTSGAIIKVKLVADASFKGGKIVIDNTLLVTPNEAEIKPEAYEYVFPTIDDGSAKLAIEPFDIKAGEEKEMLIDLTNPNDEVTLVQFDMHLPEGLSIKKSGTDLDIDMGDRTTWRKHTLDANETDGSYRFLLYSGSNTVIDGTSGAIIKVKIVADASFKGGKMVIDNTLLVSPDEKETKPARYEYVIGTGTVGIHNIAIEGDADAPIYNLRGQRLSAPQKGINIIGGKKVVVK